MLPVGKLRGACNPGCPTVAADGAFAAYFSGPRQGRPAQRTPGTHRMVNFRVNESVGALTGAGAPGKIGTSDTNRG